MNNVTCGRGTIWNNIQHSFWTALTHFMESLSLNKNCTTISCVIYFISTLLIIYNLIFYRFILSFLTEMYNYKRYHLSHVSQHRYLHYKLDKNTKLVPTMVHEQKICGHWTYCSKKLRFYVLNNRLRLASLICHKWCMREPYFHLLFL